MNGEIFNIQKFCVNDGPGIRTTVFFKGCPLNCLWCHNPESRSPHKQILFYSHKCKGCGKCANLTTDCADFFCPADAKEICGKTVSCGEVIAEVVKDEPFYKTSGGGVTLSGGEPLFQPDFALDILKQCKEINLHTAVETSGFAPGETIKTVAEFTDLFLFDFKESDPILHKEYTGVDNKLILENLHLLNSMGKDIVLRLPIIPGYNDRPEHYDEICRIANSLSCIRGIDIEPYHTFGEGKYIALGIEPAKITTQTEEETARVIGYIGSKTKVHVKKA